MTELVFAGLCFAAVAALAMRRAPIWAWALAAWLIAIAIHNGYAEAEGVAGYGPMSILAWLTAGGLALLSVPSLRRKALVEPAFHMVKKILPKVSDTEQQALDAGTIGFPKSKRGGHAAFLFVQLAARQTVCARFHGGVGQFSEQHLRTRRSGRR